MHIYLDTVIWNRLCDQSVDATSLLSALGANGSSVALGTEAIYELARTFHGSVQDSANRGRNLFTYLKRFVEFGIPCVRMTRDILDDEANIAAGNRTYPPQVLLSNSHYSDLLSEVDKLSAGFLGEGASNFINDRKRHSEKARAEIAAHYDGDLTNSLLAKIAAVPSDRLGQWITREIRDKGRRVLRGHLAELFQATPRVELPLRQLTWVSKQLLSSSRYRIAQAMTRADLYMNWRFARSGSMSRDVPSDLYHVVNSAYCGVYATCESRQAKYASLILTKTRFELCPNGVSVAEWLRKICELGP